MIKVSENDNCYCAVGNAKVVVNVMGMNT